MYAMWDGVAQSNVTWINLALTMQAADEQIPHETFMSWARFTEHTNVEPLPAAKANPYKIR